MLERRSYLCSGLARGGDSECLRGRIPACGWRVAVDPRAVLRRLRARARAL